MHKHKTVWPALHTKYESLWPEAKVTLTLKFPEGATIEQVREFAEKMNEMVQVAREELGWYV